MNNVIPVELTTTEPLNSGFTPSVATPLLPLNKECEITVKPYHTKGRPDQFKIRYSVNGKIKCEFRPTRPVADARAAELRGEALTNRKRLLLLPPGEQDLLMAIYEAAQSRQVALSRVLVQVSETKATQPAPGALAVLEEMLASKSKKKNLNELYTKNIGYIWKAFIKGRETAPVSTFTTADVQLHLDKYSVNYFSTLRSNLSGIFNFAVRRGYLTANPCAALEAVTAEFRKKEVLTLAETQTILEWLQAHPRCLGWFVLSAFAGLRPDEARQLSWDKINFAEKYIRVEAHTSKKKMDNRIVYPNAMVFVWLAWAKERGADLPVSRGELKVDLRKLRTLLWGKASIWKKDVTRHSAASYWLAQCGSKAVVSEALGNSERVLKKHYLGLVTKADAEKYWAFTPLTCATPK